MAKTKKCCENKIPSRLGKVGGQAVLEGVMMKAGTRTVTTCRKEDGSICVHDDTFVSVRQKHKILNIPILRGVINFVEMMILSFRTLSISAEALELDDEKDKQKKAEGKKTTTDLVMIIGMVLGVALAIGLFILLPGLVSDLVSYLVYRIGSYEINETLKAVIEGASKVIIFIAYLALVSLMPDIKRTFMYHGAEHKAIFCYEQGLPLTVENVRMQKRFHPRCGTSFLILMLLVGIFVSFFIDPLFYLIFGFTPITVIRVLIKLLLLPIIVGIGYELIKIAGRHDNLFTRIISAPGVWLQHITTKEPDDDMIECAIAALEVVIPENDSDKW